MIMILQGDREGNPKGEIEGKKESTDSYTQKELDNKERGKRKGDQKRGRSNHSEIVHTGHATGRLRKERGAKKKETCGIKT